jgi:hypothetical protein
MLYEEIIPASAESHTRHITSLRLLNAEFFNVKTPDGNLFHYRLRQVSDIWKIFRLLGRMITSDAGYKREIKSRIFTAKAAFNKKKTFSTSKLNLNLR